MTGSDSRGLARRARIDVLDALYLSGGGHYGGSFSVLDIIAVLYSLRSLASDTPGHDKLILSKGHAAIALYSILTQCGLMKAELRRFGTLGAGLEGHPDMLVTPNVHFSTGSLGQGLATGLGMAMMLRRTESHVWVVLGDGECQEGSVWEAAMLASRYCVGCLHVIVDQNGAQECGWWHEPRLMQAPLPSGVEKWSSFGWDAREIDGHDHQALAAWVDYACRAGKKPTIALARTRKGGGSPVLESAPYQFHCGQLTADEYARAREELLQC